MKHSEDGQMKTKSITSSLPVVTDSMMQVVSPHQHQHQHQQKKRKVQEKEEEPSFMPESPPPNKKTKEILKDNAKCSQINIQKENSSKILDQESISKEKVSERYWNLDSKEISQKLWLCTQTDWQDLQQISSNGLLNNMVPNLPPWKTVWMSSPILPMKNLQKTSSPLSLSSVADIMECKDIQKKEKEMKQLTPEILLKKSVMMEKEKREIEMEKMKVKVKKTKTQMKKEKDPRPVLVMKIRMKPTEKQREIMRRWVGTHRWIYNKALEQIVTKKEKVPSFRKLRKRMMGKKEKSVLEEEAPWLKEIPNRVKQGGIKQLTEAYNTNFGKNKKNNNKSSFKIHFKSKKHSHTETIGDFDKCNGKFTSVEGFPKQAYFCFMPKKLKNPILLKDSKKYIQQLANWKEPPCDFKIQYYYRTKEWFLLLPYHLETPTLSKILEEKHLVVSLDPGVRSFMSAYSPTGGAGKFPINGLKKINQLLEKIDQLNSAVAILKPMSVSQRRDYLLHCSAKCCIKNRLRKIHQLWRKIDNIKHHMHYTYANFLLNHFSIVLLPTFGTSKMLSKQEEKPRVFGRKTARDMASWGHYQFKQTILSKCSQYQNLDDTCVLIVDEAYTTKTCGRCGWEHPSLGGSEIFKCGGSSCELKMDRDIHAARNILIKHLTAIHSILKNP